MLPLDAQRKTAKPVNWKRIAKRMAFALTRTHHDHDPNCEGCEAIKIYRTAQKIDWTQLKARRP